MAGKTLYDKLWESHIVREEADGTCLLYIDRHLVHEVTSPQAFEGLRLAGRQAWRSRSIVANPDHNTPTDHWDEGIKDPVSRLQVETLDANIKDFGALAYFPFKHANQGIIHFDQVGKAIDAVPVCHGLADLPQHAMGCIPGNAQLLGSPQHRNATLV